MYLRTHYKNPNITKRPTRFRLLVYITLLEYDILLVLCGSIKFEYERTLRQVIKRKYEDDIINCKKSYIGIKIL